MICMKSYCVPVPEWVLFDILFSHSLFGNPSGHKFMDIKQLENSLGYIFKDKSLLDMALRPSSFVNDQLNVEMEDNERLEFLGDAVLSLTAGDMLMRRFPDLREGDLSRMRANLVNESRLAEVARSIDLGAFIKFGKGEVHTNGREKNSILADTIEAVFAAIYLDGGFTASFNTITNHLSPFLDSISKPAANRDYKSQLQELVQMTHQQIPLYEVIKETGPDHDKLFCVKLTLKDVAAEGAGKSKKMAEQDAARKALDILKEE